MSALTRAIPRVRESVVSILRLKPVEPQSTEPGEVGPPRFAASLVGSAFCVVEDRHLVTAHHVLNGGNERDANDRFHAFAVPHNGDLAYHFPVVGFPLERKDIDIAVLETGPCAVAGVHIPALPVTFRPQPDGTSVITVGFPAPEITDVKVDQHGNYLGGQFFLKSHANEGMVSAQYSVGPVLVYELNVGWHHGESGGPIATATEEPAVFSLMQHYRNVTSPHGVVAGPHRGCALSQIERELTALGVTVEDSPAST